MVVPVLKVGSIIGRKGELIKRLVEETKARVRVLEGPVGATERIVSTHAFEQLMICFLPVRNPMLACWGLDYLMVRFRSAMEKIQFSLLFMPSWCCICVLATAARNLVNRLRGGFALA
jgi:hypothetical protein